MISIHIAHMIVHGIYILDTVYRHGALPLGTAGTASTASTAGYSDTNHFHGASPSQMLPAPRPP